MSRLLQAVREFWYNNAPGDFDFDMVAAKKNVSREAIHKYGGPAPELNDCPICQKSEWASRLVQANLFLAHKCKTAERCRRVCEKQGKDKWTNWHQNFHFAEGWDDSLAAPKCLLLLPEGRWKLNSRWYGHRCDFAWLNLKRQLAQTCQTHVISSLIGKACGAHADFLFMVATGDNPWPGRRPDMPIVMMGWDWWHGTEMYQKEIDLWQPDYFISSAVCGWRRNLKWPKKTKFRYYRVLPGSFFAGKDVEKDIDLLVIGDVYNPHGLYEGRVRLNEQIEHLAEKYDVVFSHLRGGGRFVFEGPLEFTVDGSRKFTTGVSVTTRWPKYGRVRLLNKWIEYLGRARYVIFGPVNVTPQIVLRKHGECLASGAVPIMPESPDLKYLKIEPMSHYIPLTRGWRQNGYLDRLLGQYDVHKQIGCQAADWHKLFADEMLFGKFGALIQEVTNSTNPRRLI